MPSAARRLEVSHRATSLASPVSPHAVSSSSKFSNTVPCLFPPVCKCAGDSGSYTDSAPHAAPLQPAPVCSLPSHLLPAPCYTFTPRGSTVHAHLILLSVLRRIHWGICLFWRAFLARIFLTLNVLWAGCTGHGTAHVKTRGHCRQFAQRRGSARARLATSRPLRPVALARLRALSQAASAAAPPRGAPTPRARPLLHGR